MAKIFIVHQDQKEMISFLENQRQIGKNAEEAKNACQRKFGMVPNLCDPEDTVGKIVMEAAQSVDKQIYIKFIN